MEVSNLRIEFAPIARECKISYRQGKMISHIVGIENVYFIGCKDDIKQNNIYEKIKENEGNILEAGKESLDTYVKTEKCERFDIVLNLIK